MELNINHDFYCGTSRGFLASTTWKYGDKNIPKPHYNTEHKGDDISSFEFGRSANEIVVGTVKGNVRLYDIISQSYSPVELLSTDKPSEVVGSGIVNDNIVLGQKNGVVTIWNPTSETSSHFTIPFANDGDVRRFRRNQYRDSLFAVAGHKLEYTLWDVQQKKIIFAAKSLPSDQLYQLPQTTFANDVCMLNFGGGHVGAIVTTEGVTMLYDDRAQRRPVFILKKESKGGAQTSFTCVNAAKGLDHLLTTGTTRGAVHLLDIRMNKQGYLGAITGFNGAVTSLMPMHVGSKNAIASTCLDGNLRVHCLKTKNLLYKMYMKVSLKGVLTQAATLTPSDLKDEKVADSVDLDDIFATMETVADEKDDDEDDAQQTNKENTTTINKGKKTSKSKISKCEIDDEEVEELKPIELQRLWKEDIATLISTDPYKRRRDYLLSKEIKIEDDDDDEVEESNKKLKRKNVGTSGKSDEEEPLKRIKSNQVKGISMIEVVKESKHFGKKKSNRIKAVS